MMVRIFTTDAHALYRAFKKKIRNGEIVAFKDLGNEVFQHASKQWGWQGTLTASSFKHKSTRELRFTFEPDEFAEDPERAGAEYTGNLVATFLQHDLPDSYSWIGIDK